MKYLICDGNNMAWRVFHAVPELTAPNGKPVQLIYGFLKTLKTALDKFHPNIALVAWDAPDGRALRRMIYPEYKANRDIVDEEVDPEREHELKSFHAQLARLKKLLPRLCVAQAEIPRVEGDDIVAIPCFHLKGQIIVMSEDRDMLQLVNGNVSVYRPMQKKTRLQLITSKNFQSTFEMNPRQYLNVRTLCGDKSDNIPNVAKGVGEKTACDLIKKYKSASVVFSTRDIPRSKRYEFTKSKDAYDIAERNYKLMDLHHFDSDVAFQFIKHQMANRDRKIDKGWLQRYFIKEAFKSLLQNFGSWAASFSCLERKS